MFQKGGSWAKITSQVPNHVNLQRLSVFEHTTRMKIRGSVVSVCFFFPDPPEDGEKKK